MTVVSPLRRASIYRAYIFVFSEIVFSKLSPFTIYLHLLSAFTVICMVIILAICFQVLSPFAFAEYSICFHRLLPFALKELSLFSKGVDVFMHLLIWYFTLKFCQLVFNFKISALFGLCKLDKLLRIYCELMLFIFSRLFLYLITILV